MCEAHIARCVRRCALVERCAALGSGLLPTRPPADAALRQQRPGNAPEKVQLGAVRQAQVVAIPPHSTIATGVHVTQQ